MGARGNLKLPSHLRPVTDTEKAGTVAETVAKQAPAKPSDLTDAESVLWDELVVALDDAGLVAPSDAMTIRLAIRHYLAAMKASGEILGADALTQHDHKNQRDMKHPSSQVFRDHSTAFLEYAKQLGLTFVSRARTVAPKKEASGDSANPFAPTASGS